MGTHQVENSAVVEGGWLPSGGGVAVLASCAFAAGVYIILQVAAHACSRRAFKDTIDVTGCAGNARVFTCQLES